MKLGKIEVVDNFLEEENFEIIKQILGVSIPWEFSQVLTVDGETNTTLMCDEIDNYQFVHMVYTDDRIISDFYNILEGSNLFKKMNVRSLCRIKFNSISKTEKIITHGYHQDIFLPPPERENGVKTSILYMNTNDGFTVFENGTKIKSKANRLVTFPATFRHSGTTCTNCPRRVGLNIVYF